MVRGMVSPCEKKWHPLCPRRWDGEDRGSHSMEALHQLQPVEGMWERQAPGNCWESPWAEWERRGGGSFSLSPSPQQSNASSVLGRHWQVDAIPRHWLPGCPHTLQGFEKPEDEPGWGGKKCLLQLLRRPRGPVRKSGRRGLPGNHCLEPCFLQGFVTKDVLFQAPTPHLRSSSIFVKRRVILSIPAGQVGCVGQVLLAWKGRTPTPTPTPSHPRHSPSLQPVARLQCTPSRRE